MCRQARIEYEDEIKKNEELHQQIKAERMRAKYEKHCNYCKEVSIVLTLLKSRIQ